jgi:hypothetical protein
MQKKYEFFIYLIDSRVHGNLSNKNFISICGLKIMSGNFKISKRAEGLHLLSIFSFYIIMFLSKKNHTGESIWV